MRKVPTSFHESGLMFALKAASHSPDISGPGILPPFGQFPLTSRRAASSVPPREQDLGSVALGEAPTGSPRARSGPVSSPSR